MVVLKMAVSVLSRLLTLLLTGAYLSADFPQNLVHLSGKGRASPSEAPSKPLRRGGNGRPFGIPATW